MTRKRNIKRCYYCGVKTTAYKGKPIIFHKPDCKLLGGYDKATKTNQAEREMPEIEHGSYVAAFGF